MKKRIFIPISFAFVCSVSFIVAIFILCIYGFVYCLQNKVEGVQIYHYIIAVFGLIFVFYSFIRFLLCFKISLKQDSILTCGDGLPKFEKIQYRCEIKYTDIQNVSIVASEKNSKNQRIQLRWVSSYMPKKYLEFMLIDGQKKRMCINHYTKKQIIKMLNIFLLI